MAQLGQADEDEAQERGAVPLVVGDDVEVAPHVLVEEVALAPQEDGVDALAGELLHVGGDGVEDAGSGGLGRKPDGEAELTKRSRADRASRCGSS